MTLQKNTHSFRVESQKAGIGMLAGGTYVASKFDADKVKAALALDRSTVKWAKGFSVFVAKGNKGTLARVCEVSADGAWVRFSDSSILATGTIDGDVIALADFGASLLKRAEFRAIKRSKSGETLEGYAFGVLGDQYSGIAFALNGKLILADVETKSNEYNGKVLCSLGDAAKVAAKAETLALALQVAIGIKAGKKVKVERAAVRAKKAGVKAGEKAMKG